MLKSFSSVIIIVITFYGQVIAQDYDLKFKHITGPNGESLGITRGFTQDPNGFIWFGGESLRCLYRYDGLTVKVFKHDDSNPKSLANGIVESVFADKNGIIWIGLSTGLDRYDPTTGIFTHIKNDPSDPASLKGGGVWQVFGDSKGRLWLATNGLGLLDEKTGKIKYFTHDPNDPKSLSSNSVTNIYEDKRGTIWVACNFPWNEGGPEVGGLNRLEADGTFTRYKHNPNDPNSLVNNKVRALFEDSRGTFWVGTGGDGLHTMDRNTGKFERLLHDPNMPGKLSRPWPITDSREQVTFVEEDCVGKIWIGSIWSGINRYDPATNKASLLKNSFGFHDYSGWSIFQSRDGVLWISTVSDSLYRVDPYYKPIEHVPTSVPVQSILEDKTNGDIWLATEGDGLVQMNKNLRIIEKFKHDDFKAASLAHRENAVFDIPYEQTNLIWASTPGGLEIFNKSTRKFSRLMVKGKPDSTFIKAPIVKVLVDHDSVFWMTTWGKGLLRFDPKTSITQQYLPNPEDTTSISGNGLIDLREDSEGNIWISGLDGINRYNRQTNTFKHYLKGSEARLYVDSKNNMYAPTSNGLYLYNKSADKFEHYFDRMSYLYRTDFQRMVEDKDHNYWLNAQDGSFLVRIDAITKETYVFDQRFGIKPNSITRPVYQLENGKILVGSVNGFYLFNPSELKPKVNKAKILITDFRVNGKPTVGDDQIQLNGSIESAEKINLKHDQNNLSFHFATADYRNPELTLYFVKLEGYDSTWTEVTREKKIDYFNLSRGDYVLKIKAALFDSTSVERSLAIKISPPWWLTWWAIILYVFLFSLAVWFASKWRARSLQRQNKLLEEKVNLRTEALNKSLDELKSTQSQLIQSEKMASLGELTAGIAHEIQNPLNFVNNFSEVNAELIDELTEESSKPKAEWDESLIKETLHNLKENEQKIAHHGKRADAIVKSMLQHSRTSSGKKELTDINALCDEYLRLAYHGLRAKDKSFNAKFEAHLDPTLAKVNVVSQDIGRVILNLINNAFYAVSERLRQVHPDSNYEPSVIVSTKNLGDKIEIIVKDNGPGIPDHIKDKIFQPFFTTKPAGQGTGLGLSLSYDIVMAHGGNLKVESLKNEGAIFLIYLPTNEN